MPKERGAGMNHLIVRRRALLMALAAAALMAAGLTGAAAKKRLLVVTDTEGFRHNSIPVAETTLQELGARTGLWEVDYARSADDVRTAFTAENLKRYDLVFFANTTGELPITEAG